MGRSHALSTHFVAFRTHYTGFIAWGQWGMFGPIGMGESYLLLLFLKKKIYKKNSLTHTQFFPDGGIAIFIESGIMRQECVKNA